MNSDTTSSARILLVAPTNSYRTYSYLEAAKRLGLDAVIASEGKYSLAAGMFGGIHVNLQSDGALDTLLKSAQEHPFAGVVATDDATVELASRVAQALGLSHNPPNAAIISRRKDLARARLQSAGLPVPTHCVVDLSRDLRSQLKGLSFPCVVKPLALSASRGVIRVNSIQEFESACDRIVRILAKESASDPWERTNVLVEEFISGQEVALEGILSNGKLTELAVFDKPDPMDGPFFEETYYVTPSRLSPHVRQHIVDIVARACKSYGLREGPIHAELRIFADTPWIMEIASRTIGGHCGRLLKFGTGMHLEDLVILYALGRHVSIKSPTSAAGVMMIPIPEAGVLRRVEGVLAAQQVPYVEEVEISLREGYELVPLPEGDRYLGFIFSRAPTPEEAEQALRDAHEKLKIVVAPVWPLARLSEANTVINLSHPPRGL